MLNFLRKKYPDYILLDFSSIFVGEHIQINDAVEPSTHKLVNEEGVLKIIANGEELASLDLKKYIPQKIGDKYKNIEYKAIIRSEKYSPLFLDAKGRISEKGNYIYSKPSEIINANVWKDKNPLQELLGMVADSGKKVIIIANDYVRLCPDRISIPFKQIQQEMKMSKESFLIFADLESRMKSMIQQYTARIPSSTPEEADIEARAREKLREKQRKKESFLRQASLDLHNIVKRYHRFSDCFEKLAEIIGAEALNSIAIVNSCDFEQLKDYCFPIFIVDDKYWPFGVYSAKYNANPDFILFKASDFTEEKKIIPGILHELSHMKYENKFGRKVIEEECRKYDYIKRPHERIAYQVQISEMIKQESGNIDAVKERWYKAFFPDETMIKEMYILTEDVVKKARKSWELYKECIRAKLKQGSNEIGAERACRHLKPEFDDKIAEVMFKCGFLSLGDMEQIKELYRSQLTGHVDEDLAKSVKYIIIDYAERLIKDKEEMAASEPKEIQEEYKHINRFKFLDKFWNDFKNKLLKLKFAKSPEEILLRVDELISTAHNTGQILDWEIIEAESKGKPVKYLKKLEDSIADIYELAEQLKNANFNSFNIVKQSEVKFRDDWKSVYSEYDVVGRSYWSKKDLIELIKKYLISADGDAYKTSELKDLSTIQLRKMFFKYAPQEFGKLPHEIQNRIAIKELIKNKKYAVKIKEKTLGIYDNLNFAEKAKQFWMKQFTEDDKLNALPVSEYSVRAKVSKILPTGFMMDVDGKLFYVDKNVSLDVKYLLDKTGLYSMFKTSQYLDNLVDVLEAIDDKVVKINSIREFDRVLGTEFERLLLEIQKIDKYSANYQYDFYKMTQTQLEEFIKETQKKLNRVYDWKIKQELERNLDKAMQVYKSKYIKEYAQVKIAADIETSLSDLRDLLAQGYDTVEWIQSLYPCNKCRELNGEIFDLADFIKETKYNAPLFTKSHPGCRCKVKVMGNGLKDVFVNYNGIIL